MMLRPGEIAVDYFCGGGGASTGIEQALGQPIDVAVNHDEYAVAMHKANHPQTHHFCQSVTKADPLDVAAGRPVGLAWFSPDCTHFSKARGGKPKKKYIRDLAQIVVLWAERVKPRIIGLENVEEFKKWGPLDAEGRVIKEQEGEFFKAWDKAIRKAGYKSEWRSLVAADYGVPTTRKRLFYIARCDGEPIVWPEPTHGKPDDPDVIAGRKKPWVSAATIIDWSIPCPSIFLTRDEAHELRRETGIRCNRPLADKTMLRIARGLKRFVLEAKEPFIVKIENYGWGAKEKPLSEPLTTVTARPKGGKHALISPTIAQFYGQSKEASLEKTLATVTSKDRFGLVQAFLAKHFGGVVGQDIRKPFPTITARGTQNQIVTAHIDRQYGNSKGVNVESPLPTVTAGGDGGSAVIATHIDRQHHKSDGSDIAAPVPTIESHAKTAVMASHITKLKGTCRDGHGCDEPISTIQAQGMHLGEVRAFLTKYYGEGGQLSDLKSPLHSLTSKARMGLVTVEGVDYQIIDIGMRMLRPRELFNAQGFPPDYKIDPLVNGKPMGIVEQVDKCGNSAPPPVVRALLEVNTMNQVQRQAAE